MLDTRGLNDEFDIEDIAGEIISTIENASISVDINNPDKIISENISKANKLLDKIVEAADGAEFSPRLVEVGGQLINAITLATEKIYNKNFDNSSLQIKRRVIQLRERELQLKEKMVELQGNRPNQQNLIIADREIVLRVLRGEQALLDSNTKKKEEDHDGAEGYAASDFRSA